MTNSIVIGLLVVNVVLLVLNMGINLVAPYYRRKLSQREEPR